MKNLLLITGISSKTTAKNLAEYLTTVFEDVNVLNIWIDPYREARAVTLFDKELDMKKVHEMNKQRKFRLEDNELLMKDTEPTWSVFVRTFDTYSSNVKDQLKTLFSQNKDIRPTYELKSIKHLDDNCFEISYKNGWETVLSVCKKTWTLGHEVLSVVPYFPCFQEVVDDQFRNIQLLSETTCQNQDDKAVKNTDKTKTISTHIAENVFELPAIFSFVKYLFDILKLKDALDKKHIIYSVDKNGDKWKLLLKGTEEYIVHIIKVLDSTLQCLKRNDSLIPLEFLNSETIQHELTYHLEYFGYSIAVPEENDTVICVISGRNQDKVTFEELLSKMVVKKKSKEFLPLDSQDQKELLSFVEDIQTNNPLIYGVVEDFVVTLYTVSENKKQASNFVAEINHLIKTLGFLEEPSDTTDQEDERSKFCAGSSKQSETNYYGRMKTFFFELIAKEYKFSKFALQDKLAAIQEKYKNQCSEITLVDGKIKITCFPESMNNIFYDLRNDFENIHHQTKHIDCPGLMSYIETQEGQLFIDQLCQALQCVIEFPTAKQEQAARFENSAQNLVPLKYSVILRYSVQFKDLKIHLVQGKIDDIHLILKINFQPTTDGESTLIQSSRKNCHNFFNITLPEWKAPKGEKEHLVNLRSNLRKCVNKMLIQAEEQKQTSMAFSTELMHEAQFPFPLDSVAEILVSQLYYNFSSANSASKDHRCLEIYICEPRREAVFKAFTYFLEKFDGQVLEPDQEAWNRVCPPDMDKVVDYHRFKTKVKIASRSPTISVYPKNKVLYCYPIEPNLQVGSCPANKEWLFDERHMKDSLRKIQNANPEGLVVGDVRPVRCFYNRRDVRIYCSSAWGADCVQTIEQSLQGCIIASADYDVVYIVPPGLHTTPPFPKQFLVQTLFKELDKLMHSVVMKKLQKIVFVVKNDEYRKYFERELLKRISTRKEYQRPSRNATSILQVKSPHILVTEMQRTPVLFWARSAEAIDLARDALQSQLKILMDNNSFSCRLNNHQKLDFERKLKSCKELDVYIQLKKLDTAGNYHNKESMLTIFGLTEEIVSTFKLWIGI